MFNFSTLELRIREATKKAFLEMYELHKAEGIYGFALYSDEGAMTVCPSTNTQQFLEDNAEEHQDDAVYYKFEPAEWKYEMRGADDAFENICTTIRTEVLENEENDEWFDDFQEQLYETCILVLEKLKQEHFFKNIVGHDIFLLFSVSEYEFDTEKIVEIINRLNDNDYNQEYLNWMKTWSE
ncbi:DUF4303 domain-containing protein [Flavobacterium sp. '19STA2R22 D10 B1']|uniref:DUF4303 domain-containing protein n=1 Tax=Flavobacterium aerium TaxID=3037261 RepID=UPI00278C1CA5|nr:DUF4303 domain-containing protein [Flavobacterium sp. '19STA2R22 D10 B1']